MIPLLEICFTNIQLLSFPSLGNVEKFTRKCIPRGHKEIIRNSMHNKYCMPYRYMNINCIWPHNCDGFIRMLMFTYDMRNEINQNAPTQCNKITLTPICSIFYFGTVFVFEGKLSVICKFRLISCCLVDVSTYR